jgi:hypothetical protein
MVIKPRRMKWEGNAVRIEKLRKRANHFNRKTSKKETT